MLGRITPALAIELDTTFDVEPTPTPSPTPEPTPTPTPTPAPADLTVSAMSATEQKPKEGDPLVISATIINTGNGDAAASQTEFRLDDGTVLGLVDTPALEAGGSATVGVGWDTRGANGEYVVSATGDAGGLVAEENEANNVGRLTVEIRGNKVRNSSFEEPDSSGEAPADWEGNSTGAGTTEWSEESSTEGDGSSDRSATISGTGQSALLHGVPTWTSAPVAIVPGETLTLAVDVSTSGMSSAPAVNIAYFGSLGELIGSVSVLSAPLSTGDAFQTLEQTLVMPVNVTSLRIVLAGFAATDTRTAGTVSFDNVGLFGP
jgi:hypothetical protein